MLVVKTEDVRASFQIITHLSSSSQCTFSLRTLPPKITARATKELGGLLEWVLAAMIAAGIEGEVGPASPDEVASDVQMCKRQTLFGPELLLRHVNLHTRAWLSKLPGYRGSGLHEITRGRLDQNIGNVGQR